MTKVVAPEVGLRLTLLDTHSYSGLGQSCGPEAQMKLLLTGWDRYELNHTLIDNDISKAKSLEPDIAPVDCPNIRPPNALGELNAEPSLPKAILARLAISSFVSRTTRNGVRWGWSSD